VENCAAGDLPGKATLRICDYVGLSTLTNDWYEFCLVQKSGAVHFSSETFSVLCPPAALGQNSEANYRRSPEVEGYEFVRGNALERWRFLPVRQSPVSTSADRIRAGCCERGSISPVPHSLNIRVKSRGGATV
jgi:hypothetical protein